MNMGEKVYGGHEVQDTDEVFLIEDVKEFIRDLLLSEMCELCKEKVKKEAGDKLI